MQQCDGGGTCCEGSVLISIIVVVGEGCVLGKYEGTLLYNTKTDRCKYRIIGRQKDKKIK